MIFEDLTGKRRQRAVALVTLLALALVALTTVYVLGMAVGPRFPGATALAPNAAPPPARTSVVATAKDTARASYVFAVHDDPPGARTVAEATERIDVVVADWFRIPSNGCTIEETVDDASRSWTTRREVVARVANLANDAWTKGEAGALLHDAENRSCIARSVARRARELGARGVNVDFESLAANDADGLVAFVAELRTELGANADLSIDVTPGDPAFDLPRLAAIVDSVILMAYDEHEETSVPGSIATPAWFASVVDHALSEVPRDRLVVGLGSYCYDWSETAEALGFEAAMERARAHGAFPTFDRDAGGTTFRYEGHQVWCSDAPALTNQIATLGARGLTRWALWRAGAEDRSLWTKNERDRLRFVPAPTETTVEGSGDGWAMTAVPTAGMRQVVLADDGTVASATYETLPQARSFRRLGGSAERGVVLTFDDGPDPDMTPKVLDTLRDLGAEATFFVLGEQAMSHPELVRRAVREGHLVGNHSFHHPHIDQIGPGGLIRELRSTERVLEGELDRYTTLFRAPYTAAFDASSADLLASHLPAFEAGYIVVGGDVDPADWATPGAGAIADRIFAGVEQGGRIVVLHDAGGDRTQTIAALRLAIPRLRAAGYPIVSLDRHLGLDRAVVAAPVDARDRTLSSGASAAAFVSSHGPTVLGTLFTICTFLAGARVVLLVVLALRRRKKAEVDRELDRLPFVTILVPAYNEEKVLAATVRSLLASDYPSIEVLVIDDGSTDSTYAVGSALAAADRRVRCLGKPNGGKADAANHGVRHARGEIIVSVDADTKISPDAVRKLVLRFVDPKVSAVCGNVEVGNVRSALTAFQAIEYVTSQNLDRAALAELNAVTVVPGALGAWRRDVLLEVGGYSHDTLVEDADLTLSVLRAGGRIDYEPEAIARTEAPETISALWKQRFRWTYGTYQCLVKHRSGLFRGPAGTIALPNMILFQVIFPILSPLGDVVMVLALASGQWRSLIGGYVGFFAMDFLSSLIAFRLDKKPLRWLPLLLVQRFTYRQLMYLVCLRALIAAVAGRAHGWRKLERTGTVTSLPPPALDQRQAA